MSAFMSMQLVFLGEASCAQESAALFLGFAGAVECLQAANKQSHRQDAVLERNSSLHLRGALLTFLFLLLIKL